VLGHENNYTAYKVIGLKGVKKENNAGRPPANHLWHHYLFDHVPGFG